MSRQPLPVVFARRFLLSLRPLRSPFGPSIPNNSVRPVNQPTLTVNPSPPVELGKPVSFEVVLWQPPPPGWQLQYRFDFGDGTRTDWISERQATHTYLSPRKRKLPGPCRNRLDIPRSRHANQNNRPKCRCYPTAKSDTQRDDVQRPSQPRQLPSRPRQLRLTLQSPQPFRRQFLPSRRFRPHRRLCGLRKCCGSISPLASPSQGWPLSYTRNGNRMSQIAAPLAFYPHSDWDAPQRPPKNVAINYGLYFHSNVSAGQDRLETDGASSILRKKKQ